MRKLIFLTTVLLSVFTFVASAQSGIEKEIFNRINDYRRDKGLNELKYLDNAADEAGAHSKRMAKHAVAFGHGGFDGRYRRLLKENPRIIAMAENVAYGAQTAEAVVDMWLNSSGHKKNIKGDYTHTGIGVAYDKNDTPYYTQIFVKMK